MSVAVGRGSSYIINENDSLYTWGLNECNQLGQDFHGLLVEGMDPCVTPTHVAELGNKVKSVWACQTRAACLMEDGER